MFNKERLEYLVKKAADRSASADELTELKALVQSDAAEITEQVEMVLKSLSPMERQPLEASSIEVMASAILASDHQVKQDGKIKVIALWKKIAVAASIILALATGSYLLINKPADKFIATKTETQVNDIPAPNATKAMITLVDGRTVPLDSVTTGMLATQGNISIIKNANGDIVYRTNGDEQSSAVSLNTVSNPRGSNIVALNLNDGTKVWLNSESSIQFPVAFTGSERKVIITGEVYFEVAKEPKKFLVEANGSTTEVLGTHFNVNAYNDEAPVKVTLLEGSVKVSSAKVQQSTIIKPRQQAVLSANGQLSINSAVDVEETMAWKNGSFQYKNAGIETIMNDLVRWYNIEVVYQARPSGHYAGMISRNTNLSEVLKMLELSGIKTKIDGKRILVIQ